MNSTIEPDPSVIGGIAEAPFARVPDPAVLFARRAGRFAYLAPESHLKPYLAFLGGIAGLQADLAARLPPDPVPEARVEIARASRMPPLDRHAMARSAPMLAALDALLEGAAAISMPEPARLAREATLETDRETKVWLLANVLADAIPADSPGPHLFAAAAAQVVMAQAAAALSPAKLVPIRTGICPACGGRPALSSVVETPGAEGTRYATCATCATEWNEVRVKCLCCGGTKGIGYRALEETATVKAEVCDECHSWVKILYRNLNPSLDPIADDVASLGLDGRMRESDWRRGGVNPFLMGY